MKLLRILGSNLYVEDFDYYTDEMEGVVLTTNPEEALDCTDVLDPAYSGPVVDAAVEYMKENRKGLLEVVEVLG